MKRKTFTITTDPGIDDLVALMLLAKLTPAGRHTLVSSFGNAPAQVTGKNAKEFISFASPQWSYYPGASKPLNGKAEHPWPDYFHGPDGVWGVHPDVSISNVQDLRAYPKNEALISLSPMTDAYKILASGGLKSAAVMGGAFTIAGNETAYAETNIAFDPDAAAGFFASCQSVSVRVIPLDMTRQVFWSLETVGHIPETGKESLWLKKMLLTWFDKYNHEKEKDMNLHDPLAVYLTFFPEKAIWRSSGIRVETSGPQRGKTTLDPQRPVCRIAWKLPDAAAVAKDIYRILFL